LNDKSLFNYFKKVYQSATFKIDTYQLFYERGFGLLSEKGFLSYISPNTFLKNKYALNLREILLRHRILQIINFYVQVFEDASVDTLVFIAQIGSPIGNQIIFIPFKKFSTDLSHAEFNYYDQSRFNINKLEFEFDVTNSEMEIFEKLNNNSKPLKSIGRAYFGIQTFNRSVYVSKTKIDDNYFPIIDGANINRYYHDPPKEYVLFKKEAIKSGGDEDVYKRRRIVVRQIGIFPEGTIVDPYLITLNTVYNIFLYNTEIPLEFVLGIINSKLIRLFWIKKYYDNKATFPKIKKEPLESIPIVKYGSEKSLLLTEKVNAILSAKKSNPSADTNALEEEIGIIENG